MRAIDDRVPECRCRGRFRDRRLLAAFDVHLQQDLLFHSLGHTASPLGVVFSGEAITQGDAQCGALVALALRPIDDDLEAPGLGKLGEQPRHLRGMHEHSLHLADHPDLPDELDTRARIAARAVAREQAVGISGSIANERHRAAAEM